VEASAVSARLIGAIFVEKGLISAEELDRALAEQEATGQRLGEILVSEFGVSRLDLSSALAEQWTAIERASPPPPTPLRVVPSTPEADAGDPAPVEQGRGVPAEEHQEADRRPIGEIFVEKGVITEEQLQRALDEQRKTGARLGEVLVAQETLTRLALASALAEQWSDLQKLRPPEPLPLRTTASPDTRAAAVESPPDPELARMTEELRHAVAGLERRVDDVAAAGPLVDRIAAVETHVASSGEAVEELRNAVRDVGTRVEEITVDAPDKAVIDRIHRSIEQLAQRVAMAEELARSTELDRAQESDDELLQRVGELEERLSVVVSDATLADLRTRLDAHEALLLEDNDVVRRPELDETATRLTAAIDGLAALDDLRPVIDELVARTRDSHDTDAAEIAELRASLARVEERLGATAALAERLEALEASTDAASDLATRQTELALRVDELADRVATGAIEPARSDLQGLLDELAERVARAEAGTGPGGAEVAELHTRVAELDERVAASVSSGRAELAELGARLTSAVEGMVSLGHLEPLVADLAGRLAGTADAADIAELRATLGALDGRIAAVGSVARAELEETESRLLAAIESVRSLESLEPAVADIARRLAGSSNENDVEGLRGQVAELDARVTSSVTSGRTELEALDARLSAAVDGMASFERLELLVADLADRVARAADATDIADLRAKLSDLETFGTQLASEVATLGVDTLGSVVDDLATELRARLDRLEQREESPSLAAALASADEAQRAVAALAERVGGGSNSHLHETLDHVATRVSELGTRLGELATRVDDAATHDQLAALEFAVAKLRDDLAVVGDRADDSASQEAVSVLAATVEAIAGDLADLRTADWSARIDALASQIAASQTTSTADEALAARAEEIESIATEQRERIERNTERLDGIAGDVARVEAEGARTLREELDAVSHALRVRIDEHESRLENDRTDDLGRRLDELADRVSGSVASDALDEKLAALGTRIAGLASAGAVNRLREELQTKEQDIAARLREQDDRIASTATAIDGLAKAETVGGLGERVDGLSVELNERLDRHERRLEKQARKLDEARAVSEQATSELTVRFDKRIGAAEKKSAEAAGEARARIEEASDRIDLLEGALGAQAQHVAAETGSLREAIGGLDDRITRDRTKLEARVRASLDSTAAALGDRIDGLDSTAAELGTRIDGLAGAEVVDGLRVRMEIMERHLADRLARDAERDEADRDLARRIDAVDAAVEERLAAATSAADAKLQAVVQAVDDELRARRDELDGSLAALRSQIVDQATLAEQHAAASEHALRDGLVALGTQLAAGESAYLRAGEVLRGSIERLGGAIGETDRRIEARSARTSVVAAAEAASYVAFVPSPSGYRLIEVAGPPPALGETVELPGDDEPLAVIRLTTSPLPLDMRPCAYLEPRSTR
jgi:hypothetical protein